MFSWLLANRIRWAVTPRPRSLPPSVPWTRPSLRPVYPQGRPPGLHPHPSSAYHMPLSSKAVGLEKYERGLYTKKKKKHQAKECGHQWSLALCGVIVKFVLSSCWWPTPRLVLLPTPFVTTRSRAVVMGLLGVRRAGEVVRPFSVTLSSMSCVQGRFLVLVVPVLLGIVARRTR
jgi:hypothetical protein